MNYEDISQICMPIPGGIPAPTPLDGTEVKRKLDYVRKNFERRFSIMYVMGLIDANESHSVDVYLRGVLREVENE